MACETLSHLKDVILQGEVETAVRQCYEGVERDGELIRVRDTVLLRSGPRKKSLPYVAKISALWDDPKTGENILGWVRLCVLRIFQLLIRKPKKIN